MASGSLCLATIQNVWRVERQNKNSKLIARKAGELIDKFAGFTDELDKIGASLASATETYSLARRKLTSGRGNPVSYTHLTLPTICSV